MILHINKLISVVDSSFLYSVACSDPLINGSAVYVARNILDWDGTCPSSGNKGTNSETDEIVNGILVANLFSLYPVPNSGNFTISASETIQKVEIYDLNGKLVEEVIEINSNELNMTTKINPGFYLITVYLESQNSETLRFVVE